MMRSSAGERRVGSEQKGQNAKGMITKNEYIIAAFGIKILVYSCTLSNVLLNSIGNLSRPVPAISLPQVHSFDG